MNKKQKLMEIYAKASTPEELFMDAIDYIKDVEKTLGSMQYQLDDVIDSFGEKTVLSPSDVKTIVKENLPNQGLFIPSQNSFNEMVIGVFENRIKAPEETSEQLRDKLKALKGKERLSIFDLKDTEYLKNSNQNQTNWSSAGFKVWTDDTLTGDGSFGNPLHVVASSASSITGLIQQGTNVSITGSGTLIDPYIINSSGGGGATISDMQVGYGSAANTLTSDGNFTWDYNNRSFKVGDPTGSNGRTVLIVDDSIQAIVANAYNGTTQAGINITGTDEVNIVIYDSMSGQIAGHFVTNTGGILSSDWGWSDGANSFVDFIAASGVAQILVNDGTDINDFTMNPNVTNASVRDFNINSIIGRTFVGVNTQDQVLKVGDLSNSYTSSLATFDSNNSIFSFVTKANATTSVASAVLDGANGNTFTWDADTGDDVVAKIFQSSNILGAGVSGSGMSYVDTITGQNATIVTGDFTNIGGNNFSAGVLSGDGSLSARMFADYANGILHIYDDADGANTFSSRVAIENNAAQVQFEDVTNGTTSQLFASSTETTVGYQNAMAVSTFLKVQDGLITGEAPTVVIGSSTGNSSKATVDDAGKEFRFSTGGTDRFIVYQDWTLIGNAFVTLNWQNFTSTGDVTMNNNVSGLIYNPASVQATATIDLPTTSGGTGSNITIVFGGTVTSGNPVVTALTIAPGAGNTIVDSNPPTTILAGDSLSYHKEGALWYRVY